VIAESLKAGLAELAGLESKQDNLILKAPMAGVIRDHADSLTPGRWIDPKLPIAYLVDADHAEIDGLVSVDELAYVAVGQVGRFIPDDLTRPSLEAEVTEIAEVDEREFAIPYLASIFGGDVAVRKDDKGKLKAEVSVYRVRLRPREAIMDADQAIPGHVHIDGQPSSLVKRAWDHTVAVLVRESGI
jgi:putative peptide zinc metalloprotease protein